MRRLTTLLRGLPADALLRTHEDERGQDRWTTDTELLAQVVEEMSVVAAKHQRKKPREIPRPSHLRSGGSSGGARAWGGDGGATQTPIQRAMGVLQATARRVVR